MSKHLQIWPECPVGEAWLVAVNLTDALSNRDLLFIVFLVAEQVLWCWGAECVCVWSSFMSWSKIQWWMSRSDSLISDLPFKLMFTIIFTLHCANVLNQNYVALLLLYLQDQKCTKPDILKITRQNKIFFLSFFVLYFHKLTPHFHTFSKQFIVSAGKKITVI